MCLCVQAIICFEREEDAKKLKNAKSFDVKGNKVTVVRQKVVHFLSVSVKCTC